MIADIESLGFTVSGNQSVKQTPAVPARAKRKIGMEQWLKISGPPGQEVAVFSINYLRWHVRDSVCQKIPSLGANYFVNLRFDNVRKYSSVQVRNPNLMLHVPPPAIAVAPTLHPTPDVLAELILKLASEFIPTGTVATASAAFQPTYTSTISVTGPP